MKKSLKRTLALLLCAVMVFAMMPAAVISVSAATDVSIQNGTGTRTPVQAGKSIAYRAIVNGSFTGFAFAMPTWSTSDSSCTISLYKWAGSYNATVATTPVATKDFAPLQDNATNWVEFGAQPAGEYLFYIGNIQGQVGVWANTGVQNSKGFFYENGTEKRCEPELTVRFTESVAEPFGNCDASGEIRVEQSPVKGGSNSGVAEINGSVGMRLNMAAPFCGVSFKVATYLVSDLEITLSIYKWAGNYDKTVNSAPAAEGRYGMADNQYGGILFTELPAGEYLILLHDQSGTCAFYYDGQVESCNGIVYKDGMALGSTVAQYPQCRVTFTKNIGDGDYFLPVEAESSSIDGNHTPPAEYEIPADSLLNTHKVMPDTWVFTDGLGRISLTNADVGDPKEDKTLAMFYWTWHLSGTENTPRNNVQLLSEQYPEAMRDYDHKLWSTLPSSNFGWNESIYGNYRSDDAWVLRRQAEMLANAGVDVIFTDNTNGTNTWRAAYIELMKVWDNAQVNGAVDVPKVSFMLPFSASEDSKQQLQSLYVDIFRSDKYRNLWYYLDGKPMLMAHSDNLDADASNIEKEILNFFTFRVNDPDYNVTSPQVGHWGWLSTYPQAYYYGSRRDVTDRNIEQMTVGVAMNHNYKLGQLAAMSGDNIMGRSYTSDYQNRYEVVGSEASKWGYNFAEQWNYALEIDPDIVFVTGWNEWTAGRYATWPENADTAVENAFPDQYNDEFSRDIEPSKGNLQDHYYYQLVNFVRQFKGAAAIPAPSGSQTIDLSAGSAQWERVEPYYASYIGNTDDRAAQGYGIYYTETSGRNDIIGAQVARDGEYVYFHVECAEDITPYTDSLWMTLYLDTAGEGALDGWNTFEYVVNKSAASADTLVLEKFTGDGYASEKVADVAYTVDGRYMTVKIAKADLGLEGDDYTVNFAWTDNVHDEGDYEAFSGDIMDFYISGDVAPGGRFKYSFISTAENSVPAETETETDPETNPETDPETDLDTPNDTDAETEPTDTDAATEGETDATTEPTAGTDGTTDAATDGATAPADDDSGCASAVGMSAALVIALCGAAVVTRKRKQKE